MTTPSRAVPNLGVLSVSLKFDRFVNFSVGKERWSGAVESNVSLPIPITADTFGQGLLGGFPNF
jgi:hypothetical protein